MSIAFPTRMRRPPPALDQDGDDRPETYGLSSPVRPEVHCRSAELGGGRTPPPGPLGQYGGLSGIDLTIANACFTLTLCQLEDGFGLHHRGGGGAHPYQTLQLLLRRAIWFCPRRGGGDCNHLRHALLPLGRGAAVWRRNSGTW